MVESATSSTPKPGTLQTAIPSSPAALISTLSMPEPMRTIIRRPRQLRSKLFREFPEWIEHRRMPPWQHLSIWASLPNNHGHRAKPPRVVNVTDHSIYLVPELTHSKQSLIHNPYTFIISIQLTAIDSGSFQRFFLVHAASATLGI
ncbi:hypothetical protein DERP_013477 [Dermatophagoides pteronyssinus]|uniref:Uncharacterized protein n=1 Tax=Dermatophagoides pteronyssinus TaxID=6956 RepID=A0ABQ8JRQ0_DERPT|nr:hypothetical protein DERP_013477 [Dermatophagoides pteronyssinus]